MGYVCSIIVETSEGELGEELRQSAEILRREIECRIRDVEAHVIAKPAGPAARSQVVIFVTKAGLEKGVVQLKAGAHPEAVVPLEEAGAQAALALAPLMVPAP